jgi:hypothetical protein
MYRDMAMKATLCLRIWLSVAARFAATDVTGDISKTMGSRPTHDRFESKTEKKAQSG